MHMEHQTILSRDESQLIVVKLLFSVQHSDKYASRLQAALCFGLHANSSEKVWAQSESTLHLRNISRVATNRMLRLSKTLGERQRTNPLALGYATRICKPSKHINHVD